MKKVDFEEVSKIFQNFFQIDTISHCDFLDFNNNNKIYLIEETVYIDKNLLDNNIYKNELSELVKKMWGTHSILIWYLEPETLKKEKIFILKAKVNPKFSRILSKLNREIRRFKNGAYTDIKFNLE